MDMNRKCIRDFSGHPVVKNLPSNAGDSHSTLVWELRSHIPQGNRACGLNSCDRLWGPQATTRKKPVRCNERSLMPQLRPDAAKNK